MQKNRVKEIGKKNIAMKYKREQKYGWLMFEKREQIRPIKTNISCNVIKKCWIKEIPYTQWKGTTNLGKVDIIDRQNHINSET